MNIIETITTYWCDGCGNKVSNKKDLIEIDNNLELCHKCLLYIVKISINNKQFFPRLKCKECNGSGVDPSYKPQVINLYDAYEGRCKYCGRFES